MLLQFSVENFRSIKDKIVLSLEASTDKEHPENLATIGKQKFLKVATIFGANASGKSNIFKALTAAIMTIRTSNNRQLGELMPLIVPFKFDDKSSVAPTKFEFVFFANEKKYIYGFSSTKEVIVEEYLYVYRTSKAKTVFCRKDTDKYSYTDYSFKKKLSPLEERNTNNKLFLATATAWNCEETRAPFLWFMRGINTFAKAYENLAPVASSMYENGDETLQEFTNAILHEADINIANYEFESRDKSKESLPAPIREFLLASRVDPDAVLKEYNIQTVHSIENGGKESKLYKLSFNDESQGTQHLFWLSPVLKRAFETGEVMCIDEIDSSLHPLLVVYLVGLFNNPEVNKANAQLIASAHTTALLSLKELRRDQIYFVDKNQKTGISELYSLDEFSPRTNEDIQKAYLLGRFGAVPNIGEGYFL